MDNIVEIVTTAGYFKVSGIYAIVNTVTDKGYIGSTANLKTRISYNRSKLRHGIHDNSYLQHAWNLHGESNFKFFLVQKCDISDLSSYESLWMRMLASCCRDYGYNLDTIAQHKMHCEETKRKIAASHIGENFSPERRQRISAALTGTKHSFPKTPEQRKRYSEALMGHSVSEESRRKMSAVHKGKIISTQHRQQISEYWRKRREQKNHTK